jgi:hypothetical protein
MTGLAFLDTETVTLDYGHDVIWEIGLILRNGDADQEWHWQMRPNLAIAHPKALEVSRYHERFAVPAGQPVIGWGPFNADFPARMSKRALAAALAAMLQGRHVVGAVPSFDTERIRLFLARHRLVPTWHYHLIDVEAVAAGYIAAHAALAGPANPGARQFSPDEALPPWKSDGMSRACGVEPPGDGERHTALGDARWVRDWYDRITGVGA